MPVLTRGDDTPLIPSLQLPEAHTADPTHLAAVVCLPLRRRSQREFPRFKHFAPFPLSKWLPFWIVHAPRAVSMEYSWEKSRGPAGRISVGLRAVAVPLSD